MVDWSSDHEASRVFYFNTMYSIKNDKTKLKLMIEMFSQINRLSFETEVGKEFKNTITEAIEENIKPYARDCFQALNELEKVNNLNPQ